MMTTIVLFQRIVIMQNLFTPASLLSLLPECFKKSNCSPEHPTKKVQGVNLLQSKLTSAHAAEIASASTSDDARELH